MPPHIRAVLPRLRHDLAACLSSEAITEACRAAGHRCRDPHSIASRRSICSCSRSCTATPLASTLFTSGSGGFWTWPTTKLESECRWPSFKKLLEQITAKLQQTTQTSSLRLGRHRVWIVDGSAFSVSDVEELLQKFGQPGGQRPGYGFAVAKFLALVDVWYRSGSGVLPHFR